MPFTQAQAQVRLQLERERWAAHAGPLDLEIGAGVGWHAIRYASEHPGRTLIAIERTRAKYRAFEVRLRRHPSLTHLYPVHADAIAWITHCLPPGSLDRVLILYPNPEPGRRNQRWAAMPFMSRLIETMKPGATLTLATNVRGYAREAESLLTREWGLTLTSCREIQGEAESARTHFEKKYLSRGETCYDLVFTSCSRQSLPARCMKSTSIDLRAEKYSFTSG